MKIILNDFGPIDFFSFDLKKDLNIIFGKNNIGKSYAISAIYLVIKKILRASEGSSLALMNYYFRTGETLLREPPIQSIGDLLDIQDSIAKEILSNNNQDTNINLPIERIIKILIDDILIQELEKSLNNSFDSIEKLDNQISQKKFSITLSFPEIIVIISRKKNKIAVDSVKLNKNIIARRINSTRQSKHDENQIIIYYNQKKTSKKNKILSEALSLTASNLNEVSKIVKNVYFLPASRSGLYQALSTFSAVIAELSKNRNFLSNKIELPDISEPVSDYFLYLSRISRINNQSKYLKIASEIEKSILNGKITFNKKSKKIVFKPENIDTELDLSNVSSMIAEIAPIVAYLKYVIDFDFDELELELGLFLRKRNINKNAKNLIFIEEPEAHLHPEVQVLLMEMFAQLLDFNAKIVMTSHSNYMFNKLSNLLLGKKIDPNIVGSYLMVMKEKGSTNKDFLMKAEADGIEDENFVNVAEKLYEERMNLYSKQD